MAVTLLKRLSTVLIGALYVALAIIPLQTTHGASQLDVDAVFNNSIFYDSRILPSSCGGGTNLGAGAISIDDYLRAIAFEESNGDPNALNADPRSLASGKYQFIPRTWDFMQGIYPPARSYSEARFAPESVQDAAAFIFTAYNAGLITDPGSNENNVFDKELNAFWLAVSHFRGGSYGNRPGDSLDTKAPGANTETTREYVSEILARVADGQAASIPISYEDSPDFESILSNSGYIDLRPLLLSTEGSIASGGAVDCSSFLIGNADINLFDAGFTDGSATRTLRSTDGIVLHWTGGTYGDRQPQGVVDVLNERGLGVQFYVGADGRIWQLTPSPNSRAAHACGVNSTTIGIEIEGGSDAAGNEEQLLANKTQTQSVINLVADLSNTYGINVASGDPAAGSGLLGHFEIPPLHVSECPDSLGKRDPGPNYLELVREAVLANRRVTSGDCPSGVADNDNYQQHCGILQDIISANRTEFDNLKASRIASGGLLAESETSQVGPTRLATAVLDSYNEMVAAAADDGVILQPVSGYRSFEEQALQRIHFCSSGQTDVTFERIFNDRSACAGSTSVLPPGTSNHNKGRAIDFGEGGITDQPSYRNTDQYEWLVSNASTYGWSTISSEPWHWEK